MSGLSGVVRSDLELSDEILSVIPTDPFEQLKLAKKITSMAIASTVYTLEAEVVELRQKLQEMEMCTHELESKAYRYERDFREADSRLEIVLHDNMNLTKERDSLVTTVTNLNREMAKFETFKRKLVQSLSNDDEIAPPQTDSVDIKTYDQSVPVSYPDKDQRTRFHHSYNESVDKTHHPVEEVPIYTGPKFSVSPWLTPQTNSTVGSPKARTSGWYPSTSSQRSSAANSPPRGLPLQAPRIDGKEFFRQVRSRLSYEQFKAFLATIKELNAQRQTREETLRKADEIFGTENKDLYMSLQRLLNNNNKS
ncbi:PREDICTED: uncharacterized protein At4g15545-like [Camelina sativa]|uniref:Uncharacterized protein At4g15545-like n=1 Tax=Camelina sativa TaxID=90675 RepID=A0ABM0TUG8_CAMSA|nr:PREDICTED: uncharacterized protein At4g15545-like [Camelina sativa]